MAQYLADKVLRIWRELDHPHSSSRYLISSWKSANPFSLKDFSKTTFRFFSIKEKIQLMKVKFNLKYFGIDTAQKTFSDKQGNILSTSTLESILSMITVKYLYNTYESVPIYGYEFKKIANDYRQYLNHLSEKEIILIDESYEKGEFPKSYLFTDYFKAYSVITDLQVGRSDNNSVEKEQKVTVDVDSRVSERIQSDFKEIRIKSDPVQKETMFYNDGGIPVVKFRKFLTNEINLYRLRNKAYEFKLSGGRFFTPFTRLSKDIRENYFYFDTRLVGLDIKNSFPLWLSIWLINHGITVDYDTQEFFQGCVDGTIYMELAHQFNKTKDSFNHQETEKPEITRSDVKPLFALWLNGDNSRDNLTNHVFRAYYPEIFSCIETFKDGRKDIMYYELVKLETEFIFNTICKHLYSEIPDIKLITCHDQIYFEERCLEEVRLIWDTEINKVYARLPIDNESEFTDDNLEDLGIFLS
jgi:hypothetical protein